MLVLSRKTGEAIVIGDGIKVTVTRVSGNRVTIGIDAPGDVRVLRGELVGDEEPVTSQRLPTFSDRLRLVAR